MSAGCAALAAEERKHVANDANWVGYVFPLSLSRMVLGAVKL